MDLQIRVFDQIIPTLLITTHPQPLIVHQPRIALLLSCWLIKIVRFIQTLDLEQSHNIRDIPESPISPFNLSRHRIMQRLCVCECGGWKIHNELHNSVDSDHSGSDLGRVRSRWLMVWYIKHLRRRGQNRVPLQNWRRGRRSISTPQKIQERFLGRKRWEQNLIRKRCP